MPQVLMCLRPDVEPVLLTVGTGVSVGLSAGERYLCGELQRGGLPATARGPGQTVGEEVRH